VLFNLSRIPLVRSTTPKVNVERTRESVWACTLFDSNFLVQGLALIESVESNSTCNIYWTVLALDDLSYSTLKSMSKSNMKVIHIDKFEDLELQALKPTRAWKEFCWTSAACLLNYCLSESPLGGRVAYIDADCYFFEDIYELLTPLESGSEIAIHEHRFSRDRMSSLEKSGRFNVGLVAGLNKSEFKACVSRWRSQVLNRCDVNDVEGRCGDQTYLNEWPGLYKSLHVLEYPGAGLAPWNIKNYKVTIINGTLKVDLKPIYFYHFSALEFIYFSKVFTIFVPAAGYLNMDRYEQVIYSRYMKHLMQISSAIRLRPRFQVNLKSNLKSLLKGAVAWQVGRP
jgi:hypothetical protein